MAHLFLAFLYRLWLRQSFPLFPGVWACGSLRAEQMAARLTASRNILFSWLSHCKTCETSISLLSGYRDPAGEGLMETLLLGWFRGWGGYLTVIQTEYWINRGQRSCLLSNSSISFTSPQTRDVSQQGEAEKGSLTWRDITSIFTRFRAAVSKPPPLPPSLCLSASHLHFTNMQRQIELAVCHLLTNRPVISFCIDPS